VVSIIAPSIGTMILPFKRYSPLVPMDADATAGANQKKKIGKGISVRQNVIKRR
jgi:hypothetical protein